MTNWYAPGGHISQKNKLEKDFPPALLHFLFIILRGRPYFTLKTRTMPLILQGFVEHEIYWKKKTWFQMNDLPQEFIYYIWSYSRIITTYLRIVESWDGLKNDSTNVDWWGRNLSQRHLLVFCLSTTYILWK